MRPLLFDVDATIRPARMTICFPGRPNAFVTVRIKAEVRSLEEASLAAVREIAGFTPDELALLAEVARAAPTAPIPEPAQVMIEELEQEDRYPGLLHCPACCHPIGRGDSPAIGYVEGCPSCRRKLMVRFTPGAVTIVLWSNE
jgi:hypothetical protein